MDQRIIHACIDLEDSKRAEKQENELFKEIKNINATVWSLKGKIIEIKRRVASSMLTHSESIASSMLLSELTSSSLV